MRLASKRLLLSALESQETRENPSSPISERYYSCSTTILCPHLAPCWRGLQLDEETRDFLNESRRKSANLCLQLLYGAVYLFLCMFLSFTDINGLLEKGKMFVFSTAHLSALLPPSLPPSPLVLDVGSGDGHVTDKLRSHLGPAAVIHVTETSAVMRRVLQKKGYKVLDVERWHKEVFTYDLISCLNVLDRCDRPHTLLRQLHGKLKDGGILILAVVFPFKPFVEKGARQAPPTERLLVRYDNWKEGVSDLVTQVLSPLGFSLLSVSKLPYLCEGDLHNDWFALQDILLVLSKDKTINNSPQVHA